MKNAYTKDIFRIIKKNFKRFIAIMAITALGITAFTGVVAACTDMYKGADSFYDKQRLFDIRILSTLGLTQEDVKALAGLDAVADADGTYNETVYTYIGEQKLSADMVMIGEKGLNLPYLLEGNLPQRRGEIAVTEKYLRDSGLALGDIIVISDESEAESEKTETTPEADDDIKAGEADNELKTDVDFDADIQIDETEKPSFFSTEFKITGVVIDLMNTANASGLIAFRSKTTTDYTFFVCREEVETAVFTAVNIVLVGLEGLECYSDEYVSKVELIIQSIESEMMYQRQQARYEAVISEALKKITDAEAIMNENFEEADRLFAEAWQDIKDAELELSDGERELDYEEWRAHRELADARAEIEDGKTELADAGKQLAYALFELEDGQNEYEDGLTQYNDGLEKYLENRENIDLFLRGLNEGIPAGMSAMQQLVSLMPSKAAWSMAPPEAIEGFEKAFGAVTNTLESMAVFFAQAGEMNAAALFSGISQAAWGAKNEDDFPRAFQMLGAIDYPSNPMDATSPTPKMIMNGALNAADIELQNAKLELDEAKDKLDSGKAELDKGWADYNLGIEELEKGRAELLEGQIKLNVEEAKALREIANARLELAEGKEKLANGEFELTENEQNYMEKREEAEGLIANAYTELADIDMAQWYVQSRTVIDSYSALDSDVTSIYAIGRVFPILFIIVAVLISLTTMTRMVEEERGLIGTYKALGLGSAAIGWKYTVFALLASTLGSVLGSALGFVLLPALLLDILSEIYIIPNVPLFFDVANGVLGSVIFLVGITVATALACQNELRQTPATLMRPKAPKAGSRIFLERVTFVWKRLRFLNKVTARNLFRYKKRLFMTVIGIAGCTALVLVGFAIRDSVMGLVPKQYEDVYRYDLMLVAEEDKSEELFERLGSDEAVDGFIKVQLDSIKLFTAEGKSESMQMIIVPEESDILPFIKTANLNNVPVKPERSGVLLTQNAAKVLELKAGDTISLQNLQLDRCQVQIGEVVENYLGNSIFISAGFFEELFGEFEANAVYVNLSADISDHSAYAQILMDEGLVLSSVSTTALRERFSEDFAVLNYVIFILIGLAACLAFIVLFTLANTNITERERELATIKVLGFFDNEVHSYVNKETLILTMIGIIGGLPLGHFLSGLILASLRMPSLEFSLTIVPESYVMAGLVSFSFALLVNLITNRVLDKINMVEALKSVE